MTTIRHIILVLTLGTVLVACEKNDLLSEQGNLTGLTTPFNLLAQMPDARANDTIQLRTVCWSLNDDIREVSFNYRGIKLKDYSVKLKIVVNNEAVELSAKYQPDTTRIETTLIKSFPEEGASLNEFYQTAENAYVIEFPFIVPDDFILNNLSGAEVIDEMSDESFNALVARLSIQMNRPMVLILFPSAPASCFAFDDEGYYTGDLTEAGFAFIRDNMTRELLKEYLLEAGVEEKGTGTIESIAFIAKTNASTASARNFKILK